MDCLDTSPLLTKALTSAVLAALGDSLAQLSAGGEKGLSTSRLVRFAAVNAVLVGPVFHFWYGWLDSAFAQAGVGGALLRIVPDQLVFSPAFLFVFLCCIRSLSSSPLSLQPPPAKLWWKANCANWFVLPVTQFLNFWLVPVQLQVLFSNVIAVGMSAIMSYLAASS